MYIKTRAQRGTGSTKPSFVAVHQIAISGKLFFKILNEPSHAKTFILVKMFDLFFLLKNYVHASNDCRLKYKGHVKAILRDLMS